ncbi:MAG: hypothetical protein IJG81_07855 [Muribaculaceae bacterium]|nr:hypothetical protein [Muribaculaceae bacterium]
MKQLTILLSLAALLLMASCAKDDPFGIDSGDKVIYKFTAQLPGYIDSRAIGDKDVADELFFWVFDENNHELSALRQHNISFNNQGEASVEVPLTPGHSYSFAFWAQNKECKVYDPNNSNYINIDYYGTEGPIVANDDYRDAFYALEKNITVSSEGEMVERQITLRRPFSQLNYGISREAFDAIKAAGVDLTGAKAKVYVSKAFMKFGLLEGEPIEQSDNYDYVEFELNVMPDGIPNDLLQNIWWEDPDGENSGYRDYVWLSFNYFLTTVKNPSLINTWIEIETTDGQTFRSPDFTNKAVQGNKRTNIVTDFFTEDAKFNVVIDQNFDDYEHVVNLVSYQTISPSQLLSVNDPNANYIVNGNGEEITVDAAKTITAKNVVVRNVTFKPQGLANNVSPLYFNTESLTLENVNFTGEVSGSTDVVIVQGNQAKSITIKDCEFNTNGIYNAIYIDNTPNLNSVLIDNVAFNTANRNNAITVGSTLPNAMINIQNCTFANVSNAMRLFNRTNATGVSLNVTNCTCTKWETTPQYAGFFIFEDPQSATADAAIANNLFAPSKVTVTCDNVTGPHGKLMFANPIDGAYQGATANPNQAYYVYYHKGGMIPFGDGSKYPTFIFK